jgi:predicted dehydrogenase
MGEKNKSATRPGRKSAGSRNGAWAPSRRDFLTGSGALAVGAAFSAASSRRVMGANDRIRLGVIGCGGMGTGHIQHFAADDGAFADQTNASITAVCDVFEPRKERAAAMSGGAKVFHDYQDLISSGLVDAVIIASPEHWHYRQALDAAHAGLDIYLQKAMTRTFDEAKSLYEEVSRRDCVFQLGSQYMRTPTWARARELFEEGHIGKMTLCQTSYCRNSRDGEWNYRLEPEAVPGENLDWKAWLGPLTYTPFKPEYFFRWRKYKLFSAGIITDLLPHKIHTLSYVIGPRFPRRVTALGGIYVHPDREVADTVAVTIEFDDFTMLVPGSTTNEVGLEDLIRGHRGNLYVGGNTVRLVPERMYADEFDAIEERVQPAPMGHHQAHLLEWVECIRSRKQTTWNVEASYKVMTAIAMAEQAYWEKRTVEFDPEAQKIV